jgi:hypothetical protein
MFSRCRQRPTLPEISYSIANLGMDNACNWHISVKRPTGSLYRNVWVGLLNSWGKATQSLCMRHRISAMASRNLGRYLYTDVGSHYMKALEAAYWRVHLSLCLNMHTVWYSRMGILTLKWVSLALYNRVSQGVSRILSSIFRAAGKSCVEVANSLTWHQIPVYSRFQFYCRRVPHLY